ncbi:MAG TPA: hypothetical protein VMY88_00310 [Acidimicrobiales bacterium]|nr:hypothetical protein [Acidimicrobiales bacterium]
MPDRTGAGRLLNALAVLLLTWDLLIGTVTIFILGLSITFGSGGLGGDRAYTAAERATEFRGQFAGATAVALAAAAIFFFVRLRRRPDLRIFVLAGVALGEVAGLAILMTATK